MKEMKTVKYTFTVSMAKTKVWKTQAVSGKMGEMRVSYTADRSTY